MYGLDVASPCPTSLQSSGWRSVSNDSSRSPGSVDTIFFTFLAFLNGSDLRFDTQIERANHPDFELRFLIKGTDYLAPKVLCDVEADAVCGYGV